MNNITKYLLLFAIIFGGCSKSQESLYNEGDRVEACISVLSEPTTRTAIEGDQQGVRWSVGDEIALWAMGSESSDFSLLAEKFTLKYYGDAYSNAEFAASISAMTEGDYTYYGVYPYPQSVSGTKATYSLSATQSGAYDGANDIMVATPLTSVELSGSTMGAPSMSFQHLMHMIRIEIPTGRNLLGSELVGLSVTFSQNVVGDVTIDAADPTSSPTLTNAESVMVVDLGSDFQSGDGNYIWLFVNPTTLSGEVKFIGYGADGSCSAPIRTTINKELLSGRITPLTLTIPAPSITVLNMTISDADMKSRIGELLQSITFTAPSGVYFESGLETKTFDYSEDGVYSLKIYNASELATPLTSCSLGADLETASVKKTLTDISLSGVTLDAENTIAVSVPYFFYTQFSSADLSSSAKGPTNLDNDSNVTSFTVCGQTWYGGQRSEWVSGEYIMLRPYSYGWFSGTTYDSRITTCYPSQWGLKDSATVKLKISYTAEWTMENHGGMSIIAGVSKGQTLSSAFTSSVTTSLSNGVSKDIDASVTGVTTAHYISWKSAGSSPSTNAGLLDSDYDEITIDDVMIVIE